MKLKHLIIAVLLFDITIALAQQNTLNFISNEYINYTNRLNTVQALSQFRNSINLPSNIEEEITNNSAYYKFEYKPNSSSSNIQGLLKIRYLKNDNTAGSIEDLTNRYYTLFMADDDENDYTKETVKTPTVHGGFFFSKHRNRIYIIMLSHPKTDFAMATIEINNLTPEQKRAFARDFIQKTQFK